MAAVEAGTCLHALKGCPFLCGYEQPTVSSRRDRDTIPTMLSLYQHLAILFICSCSLRKSGKGFSMLNEHPDPFVFSMCCIEKKDLHSNWLFLCRDFLLCLWVCNAGHAVLPALLGEEPPPHAWAFQFQGGKGSLWANATSGHKVPPYCTAGCTWS